METRIDAIRYVPASFDKWQGRILGEGFGGNDYAIGITLAEAEALPPTLGGKPLHQVALRYPNTWVVVHPRRFEVGDILEITAPDGISGVCRLNNGDRLRYLGDSMARVLTGPSLGWVVHLTVDAPVKIDASAEKIVPGAHRYTFPLTR